MTTSFSDLPAAPGASGLPLWFRASNQVIVLLQRLGFVVGAMHVLVVPGRQSGFLCSTPVTMLNLDGQRYIAAALDDLEWVLNARAAGRGILRRGRVDEHVSLVELPIAERAAILRELPRLAPGSVPLFQRLYGNSRETFASPSWSLHIFRIPWTQTESRDVVGGERPGERSETGRAAPDCNPVDV